MAASFNGCSPKTICNAAIKTVTSPYKCRVKETNLKTNLMLKASLYCCALLVIAGFYCCIINKNIAGIVPIWLGSMCFAFIYNGQRDYKEQVKMQKERQSKY